jgi:hypothetical protein
MTIQLQPGETILKEGGASHAKGFETVGGHLWLTNARLFFKSHALNIQVHEASYYLPDIASIQPHGLVPTWMLVTLRNGRQEKFVVFGRAEWVAAIAEALRQALSGYGPIPSSPGEPSPAPVVVGQPASSAGVSPSTNDLPFTGGLLRPARVRSTALVLEILLGFFGLFGIGWIYSGNTVVGILWLVGVMLWDCMAATLAVATSGLACICVVPLGWTLLAISAVSLNAYTRQHPELFGP